MMTNQRVTASPFGGSEQVVDMLNDRWMMTLEVGSRDPNVAASIEAFINSMRGQVNTAQLHHYARPTPIGTLRGTLTLAATALIGASTLSVTGGAGQAAKTLLAGDMLGVGGLLMMVSDDCTANGSGVISVPITNRVRVQQTSGASVTWDKPKAKFRLLDSSGVGYRMYASDDITFDFGEAITP
jgi:hypothetical protein